jgi:ABC-type transport system, involved in lipoprotein release, permease component
MIMNFSKFAMLNVIRNKRVYLAYFLSNLFTVLSFFTFAVFTYHPTLLAASGTAVIGMVVSAVLIYIFSIFYVCYSMGTFLQSRKREFGVLMINGLSPKQLLNLIIQENILIGVVASLAGIILGCPFIYGITYFAEQLFDVTLDFYLPVKAIIITIGLFTLLFIVASTFVFAKINRQNLINYVKQDKKREVPKISSPKAIFGMVAIVSGYILALRAEGMTVMLVMLPTIILVIIGTYLLLTQFLAWTANRAIKNKKYFWSKTNMIFFSDLVHRLKDNAKMYFFIAIMSTVAFCAIGTLLSFQQMLTKGIQAAFPYDFIYPINETVNESELLEVERITTALKTKQSNFTWQSVETKLLSVEDEEEIMVVPVSEFNKLSPQDEQIEVSQGVAKYAINKAYEVSGMQATTYENTLLAKFNLTLDLEDKYTYTNFPSSITQEIFVLADNDFQSIPTDQKNGVTIYFSNSTLSRIEQAKVLQELVENETGSEKIMQYFSISSAFAIQMIFQGFGPIIFIGIFISIIFFISAGSLLYFRLYDDYEMDFAKFRSIARIGLTKKELAKIVTKQLALLFGIPIVIASCHGIVALQAMAKMFSQPIKSYALMVIVTFTIIQIIYFGISRIFYLNKLKKAIL